jgi:hypothetical protein
VKREYEGCHIPGGNQMTTRERDLAELKILVDALRSIAAGDGHYGEQAREYKTIARAALNKVGISWPGNKGKSE